MSTGVNRDWGLKRGFTVFTFLNDNVLNICSIRYDVPQRGRISDTTILVFLNSICNQHSYRGFIKSIRATTTKLRNLSRSCRYFIIFIRVFCPYRRHLDRSRCYFIIFIRVFCPYRRHLDRSRCYFIIFIRVFCPYRRHLDRSRCYFIIFIRVFSH